MFLVETKVNPDPSIIQLDLPDPDKDDLSTIEFLDQLEKAWAVCDRFDLRPLARLAVYESRPAHDGLNRPVLSVELAHLH